MILPSPSASFDWIHTDAGSALICRPLREVAIHLFTTRQWRLGVRSASTDETAESSGWTEVERTIGGTDAHLLHARQVHGTAVAVARETALSRPDADILVARDSRIAVAVQTADCVPVLLADRRTGAIAAVHAGWRGLLSGAPQAAIAALATEFGSRPIDLIAALGPSVGACCYEIGADVRERFGSAFSGADPASWFLDAPRRSALNPSLTHLEGRARHGRWFFDMWAATRAQLSAAGVPPDQTFVAELCTASHADTFCSFRRDGPPAGRMAAAIRCTAPPGRS